LRSFETSAGDALSDRDQSPHDLVERLGCVDLVRAGPAEPRFAERKTLALDWFKVGKQDSSPPGQLRFGAWLSR